MSVSDRKMTVQVLFPCVHGLANGQLVTINCFSSAELKSTIKAVTGIDEEIARRVIGASRYGESDGRAGIGVMALFSNPLFSGESYGLALAVADKLARFTAVREWTEIYATGSVPADGCGRVGAVGGFAEKLDLLMEKAKPGSLFLYPKNNLFPFSDQIQEKMNLLKSKKVECIAVTTVNDLQEKVWLFGTVRESKPVLKNVVARIATLPMAIWQTVFGLTLVGIGCFLVYLVVSAPAGDSALELTDQSTQEKKNNSPEIKRDFSHQEIKQEERIADGPDHNPKIGAQGAGEQNQVLILESADTDSSLY